MVEANLFKELGGQITTRIFSGILWFGIALIIIIAVVGSVWYFVIYKRKFDIKVKIKSNRSGEKYKTIFDKAAILMDNSTKTPYFRIWSLKRDFPVPKYNVLQSTSQGDYLEIYRDSEDEFYFLLPSRIYKTNIYKMDGTYIPIAKQSQKMVDPDLAFWAVKRKTQNKKMFDTDKLWMKLLPYIPHIIGGVITIFILYILLDHLPGILNQLEELARTINQVKYADVTTG